MSKHRYAALLGLTFSLFLTGCGSQSSESAEDADRQVATTPVPTNITESSATTGSVYLNGYLILPTGTKATCAKREDTTTIIIGEMPSKNAASVIMDSKGVRALSISDEEDNVEFSDHSVPVEVTHADGIVTFSGQAMGTRVIADQVQQIDMNFVVSAACS